MTKKLVKHGNNLALIIDKSTLKKLNIDEKTDLKISVSGDSLIIAPDKTKKTVPKKEKSDIKTIAKQIMKAHDATFKKLAKT